MDEQCYCECLEHLLVAQFVLVLFAILVAFTSAVEPYQLGASVASPHMNQNVLKGSGKSQKIKIANISVRNSKLTHLLHDSLGGDSKTLMFLQISPNESDLGETLCSLNFASRVKRVELGPAKMQLDTSEFLRYKQMLDIKGEDVQIKKMDETVHGLELKIKDRDLKNKNLQEKVKELEAQLLVERKLACQHVDTKIAEQQIQHQPEEQNTAPIRPPFGSRP